MKQVADDNFKFDENGSKFYRRVENTAGKGEIALRAISTFLTVFSKDFYNRHVKPGLVWERVKSR